ncbi:MAG: hypothetical protein KJ065_22500 [Anaerolineae bacterium]|nr:hypothetical protein [Anaerolineae bacterium]
MLPMFVPPPESDDDPNTRMRAKFAVVIGLVVAMLLGVGLLFLRGAAGGTMPWIVFMMIIGVAVLMGIVTLFSASAQRRRKAKHKATLEDLEDADVYSKMNKFVEDINEAEAEYLQRKLKERGILRSDDEPGIVDVEDTERSDDQRG